MPAKAGIQIQIGAARCRNNQELGFSLRWNDDSK
jgi:hypothetical protein